MLPDSSPILQTIVDQAACDERQLAALGIGETEADLQAMGLLGVSKAWRRRLAGIGRWVGRVAREEDSSDQRRQGNTPFRGFPPGHRGQSLLGVQFATAASCWVTSISATSAAPEFSDDDERIVRMLTVLAALITANLLWGPRGPHASSRASWTRTERNHLHRRQIGSRHRQPARHGAPWRPLTPEEDVQYVEQIRYSDGRLVPLDELPSTKALQGQNGPQEFSWSAWGRRIPVLSSAAPIRGLEGRLIGVVVIFDDLSTVKELERLREEYAAIIAHDLRNPIQTILLQIQSLMKRADQGELRVPLAAAMGIGHPARRRAQLVDELVDAAAVELKRLTLERQRADISQQATSDLGRIRPSLGSQPTEVTVAGSPFSVELDARQFDQI